MGAMAIHINSTINPMVSEYLVKRREYHVKSHYANTCNTYLYAHRATSLDCELLEAR